MKNNVQKNPSFPYAKYFFSFDFGLKYDPDMPLTQISSHLTYHG